MTNLVATSIDFLLLQIAQITVVIVLIGLVTRMVFRNRPYIALALWVVVLIKCVVPPLVYSPIGVFCWMEPISSQSERLQETRVYAIGPADTGPFDGNAPLTVGQRPKATAISADRGNGSAAWAAADIKKSTSWMTVGLVIWLGGAVTLLIVYALRCYLFLRRIERDRRLATASDLFPSVERLIRRLSRYVGLRRTPRVVLSNNNVGPAVFGLWRPTIILPTALVGRGNTRELAPIVLHELMHIRRGDLWLALHSMVVRALWWFHPLVWWSVRQAEWESERCCDESVVACMSRNPARYAHSLINALELSHKLKTSSLVPGVRPVEITAKRLERIMKLGQGSHKRMQFVCWSLAILAAALILPGAAGGLAQSPVVPEQVQDAWVAHQTGETDAVAIAADLDQRVQQASHVSPLAKEALPGGQSAAGPSYAKVYTVADLLDKMKREEMWTEDVSDEQVKLALVNHLKWMSLGQPISPGSSPQGSHTSLGQKTRFAWSGDQLVASGPEAAHKRLVSEIEFRRKHSFRQVSIEVRIMQGSPDLSEQGNADAATTPDDGAFWKNRWVLFQQEFSAAEPIVKVPQSASEELDNEARTTSTNRPSARATTGKSDPIVYQFLGDELFREFLNYSQGDVRNTILLAPKITLFDGQTAEIADCSQRPFVTDVTKVVGDEGVAYQPVTQVFWEGTRIQLAPTITPDGHHLKCHLRFASIDDCKSFRPPRHPDAKGIRVQHPVISTASFECEIDIPTGQTLLIGGLFPRQVEREEKQSAISRLLGREPRKIAREQMTYIAFTPRTLVPEESEQ